MKDIIFAHRFSSNHREKLLKDINVVVFIVWRYLIQKKLQSGLKTFWEQRYATYCGVDSVMGEHSGHPIIKEFLRQMHEYWF